MDAQVNELLLLATKIAREFDNIPGLPHAEIELAAQEALAHAARLFDPAKGDFTAARQNQPDEWTREDLCAEIRAVEANPPKP